MVLPTSDFRTAVITNHWNDPPKTIFKSAVVQHNEDCTVEGISTILESVLNCCRDVYTSGPNKRIFDDTNQRVHKMLDELTQSNIPENVIKSLGSFSQALEAKDWTKAKDIHTQLMTTEYEKHGSWLIGLRRLLDLYQKTSQ